jgi:hypothetical protein
MQETEVQSRNKAIFFPSFQRTKQKQNQKTTKTGKQSKIISYAS